ncbi:hypothetical protein C6A87_001415 [Mycobacterium sp. ITM-2016-00317]|uniref:hypothetical protein n=1 Tax=Mycobacterium sp. ITM-2016-00317 TaxID=2099694 RepID=UPI00287FAB4C|nr:hypothetical protein [Mycobacterium sp. ITM-2016-00317]WNG87971.1 hypothetical protein C6A87_001415 [Mycobacterium sp. ITM-2016-00317]
MRRSFNNAPLPIFGYLLTLLGFLFLGSTTAALALGSSLAPWFAVAMIVSFGLAVSCFVLRSRQMATADPDSDITLGFDPIRGDTDRRAAERYLARYRGRVAATPLVTEIACQEPDFANESPGKQPRRVVRAGG